MTYAEKLTEQERRRARLKAYASTWFGCVSEVMMDSSAIIIIYVTLLQGSDSMSMFTTSISGICSTLLGIPCAALIPYIGLRKAVNIACYTGCCGYWLMAFAPLFGPLAKYVVLAGCMLYALQRPLYGATWYPMLDNFLRPEDRGDFFGTMRFSYMLISGGLFFVIGLLMGKNPPVWLLQVVTGLSGLMLLGRCFFIAQFPLDPEAQTEKMDVRKAFRISVTNGPLAGYSVYACLFSLAYTSIFPLILIYLKSYVQLPAGQVQIISTIGIAGSVTGFFLYGKLLRSTSLKFMELSVHSVMMLMALTLFFYSSTMPGFLYVICTAVFCVMFCQSCYLCSNSAEMMALARPGNKLMATAFCQTYTALGSAVGRTVSSMLIGSALLASTWVSASGVVFSKFQTLFLVCGGLFAFLFILIPLMPSVISKHDDYYEPGASRARSSENVSGK